MPVGSIGRSVAVDQLLLDAVAPRTRIQYRSAYKAWARFADGLVLRTDQDRLNAVLNFLESLHAAGKGYSVLNTTRAALSFHLPTIGGLGVGSHPSVCRLLRAAWRRSPPKPKYKFVWDVELILDLLDSWGPNSGLSLRRLSEKLAALLMVLSSQRVQFLAHIDLDLVVCTTTELIIPMPALLKTSRPGAAQPYVHLPAFPHNANLCVVQVFQAYLCSTEMLRRGERLFVATVAPHAPVTGQTIARWLRSVLTLAGLDSSYFGAHSFRSAATSRAASNGLAASDIFQAAGWVRSSSVFARFYHKPIASQFPFSDAIFRNRCPAVVT